MRTLSDDLVATMRAEYIRGGVSVAALAQKHNVSRVALEKRATREGWADSRRSIKRSAQDAVDRQAAEMKTATLDELNRTCNAIANAALNRLAQRFAAASGSKPMKPSEYRALIAACREAQQIALLALGASTDRQEVTFRRPDEMTDDELQRALQEMGADDATAATILRRTPH